MNTQRSVKKLELLLSRCIKALEKVEEENVKLKNQIASLNYKCDCTNDTVNKLKDQELENISPKQNNSVSKARRKSK